MGKPKLFHKLEFEKLIFYFKTISELVKECEIFVPISLSHSNLTKKHEFNAHKQLPSEIQNLLPQVPSHLPCAKDISMHLSQICDNTYSYYSTSSSVRWTATHCKQIACRNNYSCENSNKIKMCNNFVSQGTLKFYYGNQCFPANHVSMVFIFKGLYFGRSYIIVTRSVIASIHSEIE